MHAPAARMTTVGNHPTATRKRLARVPAVVTECLVATRFAASGIPVPSISSKPSVMAAPPGVHKPAFTALKRHPTFMRPSWRGDDELRHFAVVISIQYFRI